MDRTEKKYMVVDVFTAEAFAGNPAAVLLDATGLTDRQKQSIAAEFNLSETTFILPAEKTDNEDPARSKTRFRWFTPTTEVAMCGHATLAGVHALVETGRFPVASGQAGASLAVETKAGTLTAFVEPMPGADDRHILWLELCPPRLTRCPFPEERLAAMLRLPGDAWDRSIPSVRTQDGDLLAFVQDVAVLNDAKPDFETLASWLEGKRLRGLSLATLHTLTPSIHLQSRFFAPAAGIHEDPVTGSVHGPLALHLVREGRIPLHDGTAALQCVQGIPGGRTGLVWVLVGMQDKDHPCVRIGGQAVTTMRGTLWLPKDAKNSTP